MPYVDVPKDLTKVESKLLFNLTKRQLIAFGIAIILGVPVFFLFFLVFKFGVDISALAMIIIMMPVFLFAFYKRFGQWPEVFIKSYIKTNIKSPGVRPYQVKNLYAVLDDVAFIIKYKELEAQENKQKNKRKGF